MKYIENIVIGSPLVDFAHLCCSSFPPSTEELADEIDKTHITLERNLAQVLKNLKVVKSINEVRRNRPELCKRFTEPDCFWLKWGKRRFWVIVGE